jgi:flagellar biosynthesis protein FliP
VSSFEHGSEILGSIQGGKFTEELSEYWVNIRSKTLLHRVTVVEMLLVLTLCFGRMMCVFMWARAHVCWLTVPYSCEVETMEIFYNIYIQNS